MSFYPSKERPDRLREKDKELTTRKLLRIADVLMKTKGQEEILHENKRLVEQVLEDENHERIAAKLNKDDIHRLGKPARQAVSTRVWRKRKRPEVNRKNNEPPYIPKDPGQNPLIPVSEESSDESLDKPPYTPPGWRPNPFYEPSVSADESDGLPGESGNLSSSPERLDS